MNDITILRTIDADSLARTSDLGTKFDFSTIVPVAKEVVAWFQHIGDKRIETLPTPFGRELVKHSQRFRAIIDKIKSFSVVGSQNPERDRTSLIDDFHNQATELLKLAAPLVALTNSSEKDRKALDQLEVQAATMLTAIQETKSEAENALDSAREVAGLESVTIQSTHFKNASAEDIRGAGRWKWATIGVATLLALAGIFALFPSWLGMNAVESAPEAIQQVSGKVLILATLSYLLVLCARNFVAQQHNVIVNRHRQLALQTFRSLVEATANERSRDVILQHAAAAIFQPQDSGYLKSQGTSSAPVHAQVFELIAKNASSKSAN